MSRNSAVLVIVAAVFAILTVAARAEVEAPTLAPGFYGGAFLKNRYISIDPTAGGANLGKTYTIRVTLTESLQFAAATGRTWWVGAPTETGDGDCIASLVENLEDAEERDWDGCSSLHVRGCGIVPVSEYSVSSVDSEGDSITALTIQTARRPGAKWWADSVGEFDGTKWSPPNGVVNIADALALLKTFQDRNGFNAVPMAVADIDPLTPQRVVHYNDIYHTILAFKGGPYPFGCPDDPCWDTLESPCP